MIFYNSESKDFPVHYIAGAGIVRSLKGDKKVQQEDLYRSKYIFGFDPLELYMN